MRVMTYRPGDVLRWTDRLGLDHDAIADADGHVIRPVAGRGVIRQKLADYDPDGLACPVDLPARRFAHRDTLARAQAELGRPGYNLLLDNCQHFATWCANGERRSHQSEIALAVAGAAIGIASLARLATPVGLAVSAGATLAYLAGNALYRRLGPAAADPTEVAVAE